MNRRWKDTAKSFTDLSNLRNLLIYAGVLFLIWVVWLGFLLQSFFFRRDDVIQNITRWGVFGDSFNVLGTLFSALGFIGLLATIRMQINDSKNKEKDAQAKVVELEKEKQERALERLEQRLETGFFQLTHAIREHVSALQGGLTSVGSERKGKAVVAYIHKLVLTEIDSNSSAQKLVDAFKVVYGHNKSELGPLFRLWLTTLKFIDNSKVSSKAIFVDIFVAELTDVEVNLLALGCFYGFEELKPFVEKFGLLRYQEAGLVRNILWKQFSRGAYDDQPKIV